MARIHRACVLLALVPLGCVSMSNGSSQSLEQSMVFHPSRYPEGNWQPKTLAVEDAWFQADDGTRLHGWFMAAPERPRAVVLYCHGNAGNITHRDWVLKLYRNYLHTSVLVFDYRGFGKSEGTPTEAGILADARAARRWLAQRTGVAETDIVLAGTSLGGAVAVDLAAEKDARGLILENTFTSLPDAAAAHFPRFLVHSAMTMRLDSLAKIRKYHGPLLQTHGEADEVIPFALGKKLFDAADGPKDFIPVPRGHHNDLPSDMFVHALDRFLGTLPTRTD
jgi:fermentation-respiration switch protein FrsA (DUF1100 family)